MDWNRGSRGWGSSGHSLFQQNILEIIDTTIPPPPPAPPPPGIDETLELSEAAADMFLNWIYRRSTDGAVEESSDETARCTTQMEIGSWLGFRNIDGNGNYDTTLPGNARFWWMEEQLRQIFQEQSDWD